MLAHRRLLIRSYNTEGHAKKTDGTAPCGNYDVDHRQMVKWQAKRLSVTLEAK